MTTKTTRSAAQLLRDIAATDPQAHRHALARAYGAGPQRIQMSRSHPWRAEHPDAVIVARPSRWGNPYRVERDGRFMGEWLYKVVAPEREPIFAGGELFQEVAHRRAVERFRNAINLGWYGLPTPSDIRAELAGRDLACWCPLDLPCHADVLLAIANGAAPC